MLQLGTEYLSDYLRVLLATIRSPKLEFQPVRVRVENSVVTQSAGAENVKLCLDSKLVVFLLMSIFIGSILNANVPGRNPGPELVVTTVIVVAYWILLGSLVHVICRLFIGREPFIRTLSLNLQVLAVIHVLSSLAAFMWGSIAKGLGSGETFVRVRNLASEAATGMPIYAYFVVQFILILIYLPLANRRGYTFRLSRSRKAGSNRGLSAMLARTEAGLFYAVFVALSLIVVELNMVSYSVSNVLLSQPEQDKAARLRQEREELLDEQRRLMLAVEESSSPARLEEAARALGMQPARAWQVKDEFRSPSYSTHGEPFEPTRAAQTEDDVQDIRRTNESLRRDLERLRSDPHTIEMAARSRLNMVRANEIVVPLADK